MKNRDLYSLLKELPATDIQTLDHNTITKLEFIAYDLGEEIETYLKSQGLEIYNGFNSDFNHYEVLVSLDFQISDSETLYVNISPEKLTYGFCQKMQSSKLRTDLDKQISVIRRKYFETFCLTRLSNGYKELSSEFVVSIRQLNSKDFMEYTGFVLKKAASLSNSIKALNNELRMGIAV